MTSLYEYLNGAVRDYRDGKHRAIFCTPTSSYSGVHQVVWLLPGDRTGYNITFYDGKLKYILNHRYIKGIPVLEVIEDNTDVLLKEIEYTFF